MKSLPEGILITFSLLILRGSCYTNTTIEELPPGVASQLFSMLTKQAVHVAGRCKELKEEDVKLLLYTRNSFDDPITLNATNPTDIDFNKKVILIIHGWISGQEGYGIAELKDAYLKRYDYNVILLDWSVIAWELYTTAVCGIPKIAQTIAEFLCLLEEKEISLSDVHLVGHSLGGQLSGLIGKQTMEKCEKKVGRITALDPAGPLYQNLPESQRLDKTDAKFVDVIHSNEGVLGYWGNCGDVDFHVNCGVMQLGCPDIDFDFKEIKHVPMEIVACHHFRSLDYMTESISSDHFKARVCESCPLPCIPNILRNTEITMGEDCPQGTPAGGYVLATHFQAPYGLGSTKILSSFVNSLN